MAKMIVADYSIFKNKKKIKKSDTSCKDYMLWRSDFVCQPK